MDHEDWLFLSGLSAGGEERDGIPQGGEDGKRPTDLDEWLRSQLRSVSHAPPPRLDLADRVAARLRSSIPPPTWNRSLFLLNVCLGLSCVVAVMIAWPIVNRLTDPWVDLTLTMISR